MLSISRTTTVIILKAADSFLIFIKAWGKKTVFVSAPLYWEQVAEAVNGSHLNVFI